MNLVKAELSRFGSRRFIQVMVVMLLAAFAVTIFTVMASSTQPTEEVWAEARAQAASQRAYLEREYANCINAVTDNRTCEELNPARVVPENYLYGVFHFGRQIKPLLYFLAAFLSLFGYLVMASYIGSELNSGGMTNLLLWRPNRLAVLGAKLAVGLGMLVAISVVFTAIYIGTFWGIANATGYSGDVTPVLWEEIGVLGLKAIAMALVASVVSFAIATVGRHTAAALGALLGYVIVWEGGARLVMSMVQQGRGSSEPWFLSSYIGAWFAGEYRYYTGYYDYINQHQSIFWWQSGILFAVLMAGAAAIAFTNFQKRDLA